MTKEIKMENQESINRPAWTSDDLRAYRHKRTNIRFNNGVIKDYYVKSEGLQ